MSSTQVFFGKASSDGQELFLVKNGEVEKLLRCGGRLYSVTEHKQRRVKREDGSFVFVEYYLFTVEENVERVSLILDSEVRDSLRFAKSWRQAYGQIPIIPLSASPLVAKFGPPILAAWSPTLDTIKAIIRFEIPEVAKKLDQSVVNVP